MTAKPSIIMDIDGTLANAEHRLHLLPAQRRDESASPDQAWKEFFAAACNDTPNEELVALNNAMHAAGHSVIICTGRPENDREMTAAWLERHGILFDMLLMRPAGDRRPDCKVKTEMLELIRKLGHEPMFAVEDRRRVVDMWRMHGIRCLHVCEGDY